MDSNNFPDLDDLLGMGSAAPSEGNQQQMPISLRASEEGLSPVKQTLELQSLNSRESA